MNEARKIKIIKILSDYDETSRAYLNDLVTKEEVEKSDKVARDRLTEMNLNPEEKMYAAGLLGDCFRRMIKMIKIPE